MVIENLCGFGKERGGGSALNEISWITVITEGKHALASPII